MATFDSAVIDRCRRVKRCGGNADRAADGLEKGQEGLLAIEAKKERQAEKVIYADIFYCIVGLRL